MNTGSKSGQISLWTTGIFVVLWVAYGIFGQFVTDSRVVKELGWWSLILILIVVVLVVERKPISSIGFRRVGILTPVFAILLFLAAFLLTGLWVGWLGPKLGMVQLSDTETLLIITALPLWGQLLLAIRAGVVEETITRGLLMEGLLGNGSPKWFAVLLSVTIFTLPHAAMWPLPHLIPVAIVGFILALYYLWRRDLVACIIAHALLDVTGFLMAGLMPMPQ